MAEIASVYSTIPLCKDLSEIDIRNDMRRGQNYGDHRMALRILLARRGKLCGFEAHDIYPPKIVYGDEFSRAYRKRFEHIMAWLEDELHKNGVCGKLIYEYRNYINGEWVYNVVSAKQVPEINSPHFDGNYKWKY